jgi:hypothetical protein
MNEKEARKGSHGRWLIEEGGGGKVGEKRRKGTREKRIRGKAVARGWEKGRGGGGRRLQGRKRRVPAHFLLSLPAFVPPSLPSWVASFPLS